MADTPDQKAADKIGRAIDGQIITLQRERLVLERAAERIAEIDAELAVLLAEKTRIDDRRPPRPAPGGDRGPVSDAPSREPRA